MNNTSFKVDLLSEKMKNILSRSPEATFKDSDKNYDLVYIVKPGEINEDLRYSLRSVSKFCKFRKIWIIGYKPKWIKNVNHIATVQHSTKWKNSTSNILAACRCKGISDNFILMNDDFFAIEPIYDWVESLNLCLGNIQSRVDSNKNIKTLSKWLKGFNHASELLKELKCTNDYNYEVHAPIIINKKTFIDLLDLPAVRKFCTTPKVFMKRSIYGNLYINKTPVKIKDVKIEIGKDLSDKWLDSSWLSVFDYVVGNDVDYPIINQFLKNLFPTRCNFEHIPRT